MLRKIITSTCVFLFLLTTGCIGPLKESVQSEPPSPYLSRAEAGDADAQYQLGRAYARNAGEDSRPERAIYWLCRAAVQGHVAAQYELGGWYERSGAGGARGSRYLSDFGSAYFWYTAAASQGEDKAFAARARVIKDMEPGEIVEAKRRATRWRQATCVKP